MEAKIQIIGERTYLKPFELKDARSDRYLKWMRDYEIIKTLNLLSYVENPVRQEELESYYESIKSDGTAMFFAMYLKKSEEFIGTVKISKINKELLTADVGIMIGQKDCWGQGYAKEILREVCEFLFGEHKMRKLTCGLMANNPGMERVFSGLGFQVEGRFREADYFEGNYIDHIYMGCFRNEFINEKGN